MALAGLVEYATGQEKQAAAPRVGWGGGKRRREERGLHTERIVRHRKKRVRIKRDDTLRGKTKTAQRARERSSRLGCRPKD